MSAVFAIGMTGADLWMTLVILVLLAVLAFFAIAEASLTRVSKVKATVLAEDHPSSGQALVRLASHPERFINPILLLVSACQTVQAILTGIVAVNLFGPIGVAVATVANVVVFFVLAEAAPKTWAVQHTDRAALMAARPIAALVGFAPLSLISRGLIGLTNVVLPGKGLKQGPFISEEEILALAEAAAEEEVIEHEERELIESIIEFGDTVAREVMVPRPDMVTVAADITITDALDRVIKYGYSRVPVVGDGIDDIVGIAYTKDLVQSERKGLGGESVRHVVRPAKFVPETKPLKRLMREMQAEKSHMAVLVDEYGGIAGLVTLEDCLEELVGDIVDEYDVEESEVQQLTDGSYSIDGGLAVWELNELIEAEIPDEPWDTVGGFVFGTLGHVPVPGERVDLDGWAFVVDKVVGRRISRVKVVRSEPVGSEAEASS
ncbi:MAG: hemolysin family protein [Acidimicrobiia bacterium]